MQATAPLPIDTRPAARSLRPGWPILAILLLFPVWWAFGLAQFIWPLFAVPMAFALLLGRRIEMPRGFGLWLAFIGWMAASGLMLDAPERFVGFAYRATIYASATIAFLYVYNLRERSLAARTVVNALAAFWILVVVGGFLGIAFPTFSLRTPVEAALPGWLVSNDFVYEMVHPTFAQVHTFLGYPVPRPSAPFVYTNDWGSVYALLVPFVMLAFAWARSELWRLALLLTGAASVVPVVVSLDRGMWLSLGVALAYAVVRLGVAGRGRFLAATALLLPMILAIVWFSPLRGLIADRFETPHSNERRLSLYEESIRGVAASPLFGFGAPRPSDLSGSAPSVGTQGQLWLVLFSHGWPGALLFVGWFAWVFWRARATSPSIAFAAHTMVVIAAVQMPFYGMLPAQIHVLMIGSALGLRALRDTDDEAGAHEEPRWR